MTLQTRAGVRQLQTLPEQIAERILTSIAQGEYAPGDRIREESVAECFEVSRGPVREALRILEKDSVVCILPNRGAHVTQLSIKEVGDIFEIRRDLVGAMVRRFGRRSDDFLARIATEVGELERLARVDDAGHAFLAVSHRIAGLLAACSGNERLTQILASLARQTRRYAKLGLATAARRKESARTWRAVLEALEAGDADRAAAAIESLIDASRDEAIRQLQTQAIHSTTQGDTP
ncbi:GntR family transcriptional regulator [Variovorax saccharolyticus]|uniref:GntR family transcriptional regulator n=1 Tax=Variovorax saccharolyticus TaxID=3053516 RepID=UPI002578D2F0|nr:GntR family transcriptional regulator [Variovorax sp. J22R187]MDM0019139.1 GntR family transcriptional regulator [Variovorax sp. J22R187]